MHIEKKAKGKNDLQPVKMLMYKCPGDPTFLVDLAPSRSRNGANP
jgi:hypothetical protein